MCRTLDALREATVIYATAFDANELTPAQAGEVVQQCARIEASIGSVRALAAARTAEGNEWKAEGFRSSTDEIAKKSGTGPSQAKRTLKVGRRLAKQPKVAAAAKSGQLSPEQAEAVSAGAEANPAKTDDLLEKAKTSSLQELHEEVAKIKAEASDQEARHQEQYESRSLRRWTGLEGELHAHLNGVPEDGPRLWRMLDPIRRRLNILRRDGTNPVERLDALDYDALMLMADIAAGKDGEVTFADLIDLGLFPQFETPPTAGRPSAAPADPTLLSDESDPATAKTPPDHPPKKRRRPKKLAGAPTRVMIRVDLDALLRGVPLEGELCEIAGYGPVPVSVVRDVIADDNPFIVGILTKAKALVGVYHHGRHPNAYQRSALDFCYPACAAQGCSAKAGLQYDHRIDWNKTHCTVYDTLDRLCSHHHCLKTEKDWGLVEGTGKRAFVPPHDPRHPRHANSGPSPPAAA